jgi:hypothetical protein
MGRVSVAGFGRSLLLRVEFAEFSAIQKTPYARTRRNCDGNRTLGPEILGLRSVQQSAPGLHEAEKLYSPRT